MNRESRKTVVAGLLWRDGKLMICQRLPTAPFPLKWEFPGGKVEPGEDLRAALARELLEELGVAAEVGNPVWSTTHYYPGKGPLELVFFDVPHFSGEPKNHTFQKICWVNLDELTEYDFLEADLPLVRLLCAAGRK